MWMLFTLSHSLIEVTHRLEEWPCLLKCGRSGVGQLWSLSASTRNLQRHSDLFLDFFKKKPIKETSVLVLVHFKKCLTLGSL